jgi:hypothetical protein
MLLVLPQYFLKGLFPRRYILLVTCSVRENQAAGTIAMYTGGIISKPQHLGGNVPFNQG